MSQPQLSRLLNLGLGRQRAVRSDAGPTARARREYIPTPEDAARVARAMTDDPAVIEHVIALAQRAQEERPGVIDRQVVLNHLGETQVRWGRLEASSAEVRTWMPTVVPGLLQTENYMRSVFSSIEGKPAEEVELAVAARLRRQRHSRDRTCIQLTTEGALRWGIPGPEVMAAQCEHIVQVIHTQPAWTVAIIPSGTAGPVPPLSLYPVSGFDLFDDRLLAVGTTAGNIQAVYRPHLDEHRDIFDRLLALALADTAAIPLLERVAADYRAKTH